jgi:two-component system, NtrC family, response regulator AtoC
MPRVLIVEDEISLARSMGDALTEAGHEVRLMHVGEKVGGELRSFDPQILLLDVRLGGINGLSLLQEAKRICPDAAAIVLTAYGSVEVAVEAMKQGAVEFLTKPIDLDVLTVAIEKVWIGSEARRRLEQFRSAQHERLRQIQLLGASPAIVGIREQVNRLVNRISQGQSRPDVPPILLTGETGTGKDLLAAYIHAALPQRTGPFVAVNCCAVPTELFESELFGHLRGAFSGATSDKAGLFETADGGTLFLDEVGDLPINLQPKLLRAIETHTVRRIGDTRDRSFDLCLVAATNRNLEKLVSAGQFREDLYYRLKVIGIELPPLRERGDDVLLLADHFCRQLSAKYGIADLSMSAKARELLRAHSWPGNVRELRHTLESVALNTAGPAIEAGDLLAALKIGAGANPVQQAESALDSDRPINLEEVEKQLIQRALQRTGGNVSAAARLLSIGREAMRYRMIKFGLTPANESDE